MINNASSYIQWQVIRKNSAFLKRQRGINKMFSTERFNLTSVNSIRFNGLVNRAGADIQPNKDGKGLVLTLKKKKATKSLAKSSRQVVFAKKGSSRTHESIKAIMATYKPSHSRVAQRRASQILRSLKPAKKNKRNKKE